MRRLALCVASLLATSCDDEVAGPPAASDSAVAHDASSSPSTTGTAPDSAAAPGPAASVPVHDASVDAAPLDATFKPPDLDAAPKALDASAPADAAHAPDASADAEATTPADAALGDEDLRQSVVDKLRTCGVIGPGLFYEQPIEDAFSRCTAHCTIDADCTGLKNSLCTNTLPDIDLASCYHHCANLPFDGDFKCDVDVRRAWVCDLFENCAHGEDEANCAVFSCKSGQVVKSPHVHCDGEPQCDDASDEDGCAAYCPG